MTSSSHTLNLKSEQQQNEQLIPYQCRIYRNMFKLSSLTGLSLKPQQKLTNIFKKRMKHILIYLHNLRNLNETLTLKTYKL